MKDTCQICGESTKYDGLGDYYHDCLEDDYTGK